MSHPIEGTVAGTHDKISGHVRVCIVNVHLMLDDCIIHCNKDLEYCTVHVLYVQIIGTTCFYQCKELFRMPPT